MADDTQAQPAASDQQQAPMPSADKQEAPKQEQVGFSEQASPTGESKPEQQAQALPEGVKERTSEQFEKLKTQMAAERERRLKLENALREQQVAPTQAKQDPKNPEWYNPETQEVDVGALNTHMSQLEQRALRAEQAAQGVATQNTAAQEREAYAAHPELDPGSDKFNEDFHSVVRGYLTDAMLGGKQVSFKEAADKIRSIGLGKLDQKVEEAKEAGAKQAMENLTPKEEATLAATGRPDRRTELGDQSDLELKTREGNQDAIVARLSKLPPVGKQ